MNLGPPREAVKASERLGVIDAIQSASDWAGFAAMSTMLGAAGVGLVATTPVGAALGTAGLAAYKYGDKALAAYESWSAANPAKAKVVDHVVGDLAGRAYRAAVPPKQRGGWKGAAYSFGRKAFSAYRGFHRSRYLTRRKRWTKMRRSLGRFAKKWRFGRGRDARTRWRNALFRARGARITRFMP